MTQRADRGRSCRARRITSRLEGLAAKRVNGREAVAARRRDLLGTMGKREGVRKHDQTGAGHARLGLNRYFHLADAVDRQAIDRHAESRCGSLDDAQIIPGVGGGFGVEQDHDPRHNRSDQPDRKDS